MECFYCRTRERKYRMGHCGDPACRTAHGQHLSRLRQAKKKRDREENKAATVYCGMYAVRPVETGPWWQRHLENLAAHYEHCFSVIRQAGHDPNRISGRTADVILLGRV